MIQILSDVPSPAGEVGDNLRSKEVPPVTFGALKDQPHPPNKVGPAVGVTILTDLLEVAFLIGHGKL